jgi:hypothetical protein
MKSLLRIVVLLVLVSGLHLSSAHAGPPRWCIGTCTVHCDDGSTLYYSTPEHQCCLKAVNCPTDGWAEWWPGYSIECFGANASIC